MVKALAVFHRNVRRKYRRVGVPQHLSRVPVLHAVCSLFFHIDLDSQLLAALHKGFRRHIGVGDSRRTRGNCDDRFGVCPAALFRLSRSSFQVTVELFRRLGGFQPLQIIRIGHAGHQFRQQFQMGAFRLRLRDG